MTGKKRIALILFVLVFPFCSLKEEPHRKGPNLIIISIDSLRADHMGCYGYSRKTTPFLDGLAQEGVLFQNTFSTTSWTLPSHAALFTSLFDCVHGVVADKCRLDPMRTTLAEVLKQEGYAAAAFHSSPYLDSRYGLDAGFDTYCRCDHLEALQKVRKSAGIDDLAAFQKMAENNPSSLPKEILQQLENPHRTVTGPLTTTLALNWLVSAEKQAGKPFFLFLHYWDVHYDYIPPAPFDTRFGKGPSFSIDDYFNNPHINDSLSEEDRQAIISRYDGEIAFTDENIRKLFDGLEKVGVLGDTLVCIMADHGEEFFEHGGKGHRQSLYDEVLHVPLILYGPRYLPERGRIGALSGLVDVAPTVLDILSIPRPPEMMGRSLLPLIRGEESWTDRALLCELYERRDKKRLSALRTSQWKVIKEKKGYSFYHLTKDPMERKALLRIPGAKSHIILLEKTLEDYRKKAEALPKAGSGEVSVGKMLKQQLKALGYME